MSYRGEAAGSRPLLTWEISAFYAVMAAAALFPVLVVGFPPLADLPNHLARIHIMNTLPADADLQRHYDVQWQLLSFQSSDLILPPLAKLVGLEAASRLYIAATFAALLGGVCALHKVLFRSIGLWPAAAFLLLYNFMFAWGLLNFLFTAGLALVLFAVWIRTAPKQGVLGSAGFALGALVIFFFHFFAFAVFALALMAFEAWRWWRDRTHLFRRLLLSGAVLVVPVVLFLLAPRSPVPTYTVYGNVDEKIRAVLSPFNMYFGWEDHLLALSAILLFWIARQKRLLAFAQPMLLPFLAVVLAAVAMPSHTLSVWGADFRLPTIALLLLIGGTDLALNTRRWAAIFAGVIALLMLVRVANVTADWRRMDTDFSELRAATEMLEPGSKVVVVQAMLDHRNPPAPSLFPYRHIAGLAVIERDVLLPHLFTTATPLRYVGSDWNWKSDQLAVFRRPEWHPKDPAFAAADAATKEQVELVQQKIQAFDLATSTTDWSDWPEQFDTLISFDYGRPENPVPALLTELHRGSFFSIFRIHPPAR